MTHFARHLIESAADDLFKTIADQKAIVHSKSSDLTKMMRAAGAITKAKKELADLLGRDDKPLVLSNNLGDLGALVTREVDQKRGKWRVTWFSRKGFQGDAAEATKAAVILRCFDDGYTKSAPDMLKQFMKSSSFSTATSA